jgi:hypothetical protein
MQHAGRDNVVNTDHVVDWRTLREEFYEARDTLKILFLEDEKSDRKRVKTAEQPRRNRNSAESVDKPDFVVRFQDAANLSVSVC